MSLSNTNRFSPLDDSVNKRLRESDGIGSASADTANAPPVSRPGTAGPVYRRPLPTLADVIGPTLVTTTGETIDLTSPTPPPGAARAPAMNFTPMKKGQTRPRSSGDEGEDDARKARNKKKSTAPLSSALDKNFAQWPTFHTAGEMHRFQLVAAEAAHIAVLNFGEGLALETGAQPAPKDKSAAPTGTEKGNLSPTATPPPDDSDESATGPGPLAHPGRNRSPGRAVTVPLTIGRGLSTDFPTSSTRGNRARAAPREPMQGASEAEHSEAGRDMSDELEYVDTPHEPVARIVPDLYSRRVAGRKPLAATNGTDPHARSLATSPASHHTQGSVSSIRQRTAAASALTALRGTSNPLQPSPRRIAQPVMVSALEEMALHGDDIAGDETGDVDMPDATLNSFLRATPPASSRAAPQSTQPPPAPAAPVTGPHPTATASAPVAAPAPAPAPVQLTAQQLPPRGSGPVLTSPPASDIDRSWAARIHPVLGKTLMKLDTSTDNSLIAGLNENGFWDGIRATQKFHWDNIADNKLGVYVVSIGGVDARGMNSTVVMKTVKDAIHDSVGQQFPGLNAKVSPADFESWADGRQPRPTLMVSNIPAVVLEAFRAGTMWVWGDACVITFDYNHGPSTFMGTVADNTLDKDDLFNVVGGDLCANPQIIAIFDDIAKHYPDEPNDYMQHFRKTLTFEPLRMRSPRSNVDIVEYNIYAKVPRLTGHFYSDIRRVISSTRISTDMDGVITIHSGWRCSTCTAWDHPRGLCRARSVRGWDAPQAASQPNQPGNAPPPPPPPHFGQGNRATPRGGRGGKGGRGGTRARGRGL